MLFEIYEVIRNESWFMNKGYSLEGIDQGIPQIKISYLFYSPSYYI